MEDDKMWTVLVAILNNSSVVNFETLATYEDKGKCEIHLNLTQESYLHLNGVKSSKFILRGKKRMILIDYENSNSVFISCVKVIDYKLPELK